MSGETQVVAAREQNKYYTYADIFYVNRHSFFGAGQDSYTLPPAQNQDMFLALTNVEPITQGILQRRRGYTLFANSAPVNPFQRAYSYRNDSQSLRNYIWTSATQVLVTDETGNTIVNNLFTPSPGARIPRAVLSRDYEYFADGIAVDYKKWNGSNTGTLTNWGINVGNIAVSTFGPRFAGAAVSQAGPNVAWTNPGNLTGACDGAFASAILLANHRTNNLYASTFGFGAELNGQSITGIVLTMTFSGGTGIQTQLNATLTLDGVALAGTSKIMPQVAGTTTLSFGSPTDLWGNASLTPAQLQASSFGVFFNDSNNSGTNNLRNPNIDCVSITVYVTPGVLALNTSGAGNITLLSGRTYFYAFQNSQTVTVSSLSPPSLSTGPLTNNNVVITAIPTSLDPQVDTVLVLATADGNDQTTLFLVGTVPNGTSTFTDNTPDALTAAVTTGQALLTNPVYQQTDQFGNLIGVANNNPPPVADFPVKHKGRLYMALGHTLFFSKNLTDVTTSTGTITSKWEEAWPSTNQIDLSEFAETIKALLSDGETLWIATERNIRRLIGDSPINFQKPEIQFNETGVLSQEVWKVVFYEGQPVGTMWLTPDNRVMASDFNTYQDVGTHIQDVLNSINPGATVGPHASFVSQQAFDLYMLYVPTGTNLQPDTVCVYNMRTKLWTIWKPSDLATISLFNIAATGQPQWLFASNAGPLYFWDATVNQDRNLNTPILYPVTIQTTWMDFGDYNIRKFVNQIIPTTADNLALTVQVDAASNEQDFNSPLSVVIPTTVTPAAIPDDVFVPLASGPSHSRAFRFTFVSPPSTIQNILTGFAIESGAFHRY
jgi:hypothetical protein